MNHVCRPVIALFVLFLTCNATLTLAQTVTVSSGTWSDPNVWNPAAVPGNNTNASPTHPLILDQNITIGTGDYLIYGDVTDLPGGTAFTLTATTAGGILDIKSGTTTFEGAAALDNNDIFVRSGATLITGTVTISNGTNITVEAGGTWIINGDMTNNNNGGGVFSIAGIVTINGDYNAPVGSVELTGGGDIITTGTVTTTGGSSVFGSTNDCGAGPCSGQNLCSFSNTITASQIVCSGNAAAGLTGNAVASSTYAWESSTTSATSGFAAASGTNNAQDYTVGTIAQTTWFRRKVTKSGCTGTSVAVQVTILAGGGWLGTTSNWNTASNWCANAVPTSTTDVTINTGGANMPQITAASSCRNLTINSGASVTINGSNTLSIYGNFSNSGTFTTNTSTITLAGSSQQTISGSAPSFNNLTINNSTASTPAVVFSNFATVSGTLTMTVGNANLSGYGITVGTSAGSPGTLSYTAGRFYGGTITRYFNTPTVAIGNVAGLFPIGSSTDYRPFYVGYGTALTTGGTVRVGHTSSSSTSVVSFADGASTVLRRQDSYWTVSTSGITSAATDFLARVEATGLGTVTDVTLLRLTRSADVAGTAGTNGGSTSNPQVNRTGLSLANLTNSFHIASVDLASPMPVTLLNFSGRMNSTVAELSWSTASERNFDHFEIERMYADGEFESIGKVYAKGSAIAFTKYSFTDINVLPGTVYYRLKIVDWNNSYEYSKVIHVLADESPAWLAVYPNPSVDRRFNLDIYNADTEPGRIIIYDQLGRILIDQEIVNSSDYYEIPPGVASGVCFVRVSSAGRTEVIKLLVR